MNGELIWVLSLLAIAVVLFATGKVRMDAIALMVIVAFVLSGTLTLNEAFSGMNGALTAIGQSYDYLLVKGDKRLTISMFGCRMRNYVSKNPITVQNKQAKIQAVACIDKNEELYNKIIK